VRLLGVAWRERERELGVSDEKEKKIKK